MTVAPRDTPRPPSALRSYVPPVLFVLLAGVVGPIFLVMGLVAEGPETGWLLPTGLLVTALDIVIGLLIGRGRHQAQVKMHHLRRVGRPATAQVLSFDQTGVRVNDQPMLVLKMRIHGEDLVPFEVQAREVVPEIRIPLLHAGQLPVLVDPETHEWEIDWDAARPVAPPAPVDPRTPAERLAELDDLLRRDLVSREEYDATRARILDEI